MLGFRGFGIIRLALGGCVGNGVKAYGGVWMRVEERTGKSPLLAFRSASSICSRDAGSGSAEAKAERRLGPVTFFGARALRRPPPGFDLLYIEPAVFCGHTIYIYIYVSMYVCMLACLYVCMYACMYVGMYVCRYVCTYVCMYVCMC